LLICTLFPYRTFQGVVVSTSEVGTAFAKGALM
jgi:hypothetical protein